MLNTPATVIHRTGYTPPAFFIDTVTLEFDLEAQHTLITNRMQVRRNPAAPQVDLQLHGEALTLISATLNGELCTHVDVSEPGLTLTNVPDTFELIIKNTCAPAANTSLMGLYVSNSNFFTQCEAEGFRKITYFLDRPDVMARYTVTLRANKADYPVLLCNGNLIEANDLPDGRHYTVWHDPFVKPSYLFALVAGKLVSLDERIVTQAGAEKLLQVWVEPQDLDKTRHAMDSLIHAIKWDEARFGLALDLERFMIVAVSDFNMGAMENKGLNIFNTKYVLANPQTATDVDYANIEAVVGHEYFHNWTGNRVTCRDWFQLSLKEGLTVFRDQEFSADMAAAAGENTAAAAYATKRIEDVCVLRQVQFAEDAGPMTHPIRPDSYVEINNFYTATVYEKGAEVVRMYQTLFGRDGFRRGMDLYFERHDGQAVTCDDFRQAMSDANGRDLTQFERWYSQAGTPRVQVKTQYEEASRTYKITLTQSHGKAASTSPASNNPLLIPFALGLVDVDGQDIALQLDSEKASSGTTRVLELNQTEQIFCFINVARKPIPSLLRNFSAPVTVEYDYSDDELAFLFAHDNDPFNRWEAGQRLATRTLLTLAQQASQNATLHLNAVVTNAFKQVLLDEMLTPEFRAQALSLPSEIYLAEQMKEANPAALHTARQFFRTQLANALAQHWQQIYARYNLPGAYQPTPVAAGQRALKNLALSYMLAANQTAASAVQQAVTQYDNANNMTDRSAALAGLLYLGGAHAQSALADFYKRFEQEPLAIDKWFNLQATQRGADRPVIEIMRSLMQHPVFHLQNPNRARSLIFAFVMNNPAQFHAADGSGYAFWAEQVQVLDTLNPQVAARLARALENWRKFITPLRTQMRAALETVLASVQSKDVREVIEKALA